MTDLGPTFTRGRSFRARAEARQRQFRAEALGVGWSEHGHWLDEGAARSGANFVIPIAFEEAKARQAQGKGVAERTFNNMLSSQAMCFNLFAPLSTNHDLAGRVFGAVLPHVGAVSRIRFEYTPSNDVFRDQSGRGGVDCDLLVEATDHDDAPLVVAIETKFVEPEFSTCGFRKSDRRAKGLPICPDDVTLGHDGGGCLYTAVKRYRYWQRTVEARSLRPESIPQTGCPFGGPFWQLWVNHTLAHVEARARGVAHALFAVCAPEGNDTLDARVTLDEFRSLVADPSTVAFIGVEALIAAIGEVAETPDQRRWHEGLVARYAGI
jgi:hypothetical protein